MAGAVDGNKVSLQVGIAGYLAFGRSACTGAAREGIASFKEKRPLDFSKTKQLPAIAGGAR